MVRAPRPVACTAPGITDSLLPDKGVLVFETLDLAGERDVMICVDFDDFELSVMPDGVGKCP